LGALVRIVTLRKGKEYAVFAPTRTVPQSELQSLVTNEKWSTYWQSTRWDDLYKLRISVKECHDERPVWIQVTPDDDPSKLTLELD
jgi:hypothetical protein